MKMAHTYIMTRGVKHLVDLFITQLQGKFLPFKLKKERGKKPVDTLLPVAVRPIQLWEVVYPKDQETLMMNTLFGPNGGVTQHKKHEKFVWGLRKILGVKPIPDYEPGDALGINKDHIEVVGIGTKDDYDVEGTEML